MNHIRFKNLFKKHFESGFAFYFALSLIFFIGIIIGAILIKAFENDTKIILLKHSNAFFYNVINKTFTKTNVFKTAVYFNSIFIILAYILGLVNIGFIVIPIIIFIKGLLLGYSVGYLIYNFGLKGFVVSILGVYPQYLLYIPALISIGAISMIMSYKFKITPSKRIIKTRKIDFLDYSFIFLIFALILILGSLYEGFISPSILNLINEFY